MKSGTCHLSPNASSSKICACGFFSFAFCSRSAWAGIVDDVRVAWPRTASLPRESALNSYRANKASPANTSTPIPGWARAALDQGQYDQAAAYAKQTKALVLEQLKQRPLDADPHLPIALGAALEVQSQVLAERGQRTQAVALLQAALRTYGNTSIHDRLQKNLNLLSLQGKSAPALKSDSIWDRSCPRRRTSKAHRCCCFSGRTGAQTAKPKRRSLRSCARNLPARDCK